MIPSGNHIPDRRIHLPLLEGHLVPAGGVCWLLAEQHETLFG
jgi:hypothetical protein